jgi:hypothetical protein
VAEGELDEHKVDEKELGRVVFRIHKGRKLFVAGVVEQGVLAGEFGKGYR